MSSVASVAVFHLMKKKMLQSGMSNILEVWHTLKPYMQLLNYLGNDININPSKKLQIIKLSPIVISVLSNMSYFPFKEY